MKPRVAVCIHGLLGKSSIKKEGIPQDVIYSLKSLKENVLNDNNHEIFAHTWSNQDIENTFNLLNPNIYSITNPIDFKKPNQIILYKYALKRGLKKFISYFSQSKFNFYKAQKRLNNYMSRFYSHGACLHLMKNYAEINKIKYTHVLVTRYDLEFFTKFNFSELSNEYIYLGKDTQIFDENNNKVPNRYYWQKKRNKEKLRIEYIDIFSKYFRSVDDLFYLCSYENAIKMSNLFEKINFYLSTGTPVSPHYLLERHIKEIIGMKNIRFCKKRLKEYDISRRYRFKETF